MRSVSRSGNVTADAPRRNSDPERTMDFTLPPDNDPRRVAIRDWISTHPSPTGREWAASGYVAPQWPEPWGLGADPVHQLIVEEELHAAGAVLPESQIGIGWAGPTIIAGGDPEQAKRYLPPMLAGEEQWCQLFSEPDAGSDLANLATRAERDGDTYVINGQKIWSTWADHSQFGILIARTDINAPKQKGISYFILPMDSPGITVVPITEMTGEHHFNEVFFDDVRIPVGNRVGPEHGGWALTKVTLAFERISLSKGGVIWSMGPTADEFFDLVRAHGGIADPVLRQRAARIFTEKEILRLLGLRVVSAAMKGREPGPEASIKKMLSDGFGQRITELAKDLAGTHALLDDAGPMGTPVERWNWAFLFARALTIGGGTAQVQRNIVAERVLGLPRDIDPYAGMTWQETRLTR